MIHLPRALAAPIAALALLAAAPQAAQAEADLDAARAVAERLVEQAHGAMADPGLSDEERRARLRAAVDESFAFDVWERFLLGQRAEKLSAEQLAEFRALLPDFLADLYETQFGEGLRSKPVIREVRPARNDALVRADIPRASGKPLPVDWRMRGFADRGYLVIDVMVGGASMLIIRRDEFASVIDREGPEALLDHMRRGAG